MENKPLMSPDRVLSLVVLNLSVLMILSAAYLSYAQVRIDSVGATIQASSARQLEAIYSTRQQQVLGVQDEELSGDVTMEEVEE